MAKRKQTRKTSPKRTALHARQQTAGYKPWGRGYPLTWVDRDKVFSWGDVERMKRDPQVQMGLRILCAPIAGVKARVFADHPSVEGFAARQFERIWQRSLGRILKFFEYGHSAGEVTYLLETNRFCFNRLHDVHPLDARPLRSRDNGPVIGVRVRNIARKSQVDLAPPNCLWMTNDSEYGQLYGISRMAGAYEPWMEKRGRHGAIDVRRLWFIKNAYNSGVIRHPPGQTEIADGTYMANQDIARQLIETLETGGILVMPNTRDQDGNYLWTYDPPQMHGTQIENLLDYPKQLDREILIGLGIPPELVDAATVGSGYSGRAIPAQVFFSSLDQVVDNVIQGILEQTLKPLVAINFGSRWARGIEVVADSLAELVAREPQQISQTVRTKDTDGIVGNAAGPDNPLAAAMNASNGQPPAMRMSFEEISMNYPKLARRVRKLARKTFLLNGSHA
jgi:hypothetical protein